MAYRHFNQHSSPALEVKHSEPKDRGKRQDKIQTKASSAEKDLSNNPSDRLSINYTILRENNLPRKITRDDRNNQFQTHLVRAKSESQGSISQKPVFMPRCQTIDNAWFSYDTLDKLKHQDSAKRFDRSEDYFVCLQTSTSPVFAEDPFEGTKSQSRETSISFENEDDEIDPSKSKVICSVAYLDSTDKGTIRFTEPSVVVDGSSERVRDSPGAVKISPREFGKPQPNIIPRDYPLDSPRCSFILDAFSQSSKSESSEASRILPVRPDCDSPNQEHLTTDRFTRNVYEKLWLASSPLNTLMNQKDGPIADLGELNEVKNSPKDAVSQFDAEEKNNFDQDGDKNIDKKESVEGKKSMRNRLKVGTNLKKKGKKEKKQHLEENTVHKSIDKLKSLIPLATEPECMHVLKISNGNIEEAVKLLKINRLAAIGPSVPNNDSRKILKSCGWDLNKATQQLKLHWMLKDYPDVKQDYIEALFKKYDWDVPVVMQQLGLQNYFESCKRLRISEEEANEKLKYAENNVDEAIRLFKIEKVAEFTNKSNEYCRNTLKLCNWNVKRAIEHIFPD